MNLPEAIARLRAVVDGLGRARVRIRSTIAAVASARDTVAGLASGSRRVPLKQAAAGFAAGAVALEQADALLASAIADLRGYGRGMGVDVAQPSASAACREQGSDDTVGECATDYIRRAARTLPDRPGGRGPTRGWLLDATGRPLGDSPIRSGEDGSLLRDLNLNAKERAAMSLLSHVESHVAAAMRRGEASREAILVLNNEPCAGQYGCSSLLADILPNGSRLAIYVTDGERTWLYGVFLGTGGKIRA